MRVEIAAARRGKHAPMHFSRIFQTRINVALRTVGISHWAGVEKERRRKRDREIPAGARGRRPTGRGRGGLQGERKGGREKERDRERRDAQELSRC